MIYIAIIENTPYATLSRKDRYRYLAEEASNRDYTSIETMCNALSVVLTDLPLESHHFPQVRGQVSMRAVHIPRQVRDLQEQEASAPSEVSDFIYEIVPTPLFATYADRANDTEHKDDIYREHLSLDYDCSAGERDMWLEYIAERDYADLDEVYEDELESAIAYVAPNAGIDSESLRQMCAKHTSVRNAVLARKVISEII